MYRVSLRGRNKSNAKYRLSAPRLKRSKVWCARRKNNPDNVRTETVGDLLVNEVEDTSTDMSDLLTYLKASEESNEPNVLVNSYARAETIGDMLVGDAENTSIDMSDIVTVLEMSGMSKDISDKVSVDDDSVDTVVRDAPSLDDADDHELAIDANIDVDRLRPAALQGRSVVNVAHFFAEMQRLSEHCVGVQCYLRDLVLVDSQRFGLKTKYFVQCQMCHYTGSFWSEPDSDEKMDINRSAVAGTITAGIGHSQLEELLAAMDVPCMAGTTYRKYHEEISEGFDIAAEREMEIAGRDEKRMAIERGDVVDGIPHIPVVADGSWMKRSYRTGKYDSLSGVGIIVEYHTKKVLFLGVRNKYCTVCARAAKKNVEAEEHACFKNWESNRSSSSMESDAILQGFKCSIEMHGLIYSVLIADGDSSVLKKIERDSCPYDNTFIKKIECTNHLLRNLANKIKDVAKTKGRLGKWRQVVHGSTLKVRTAVVKAVQYRRNELVPQATKMENLRNDILNIQSHIFGEHKNCAHIGYFCDGQRKDGEANVVLQLKNLGLYERLEDAVKNLSRFTDSLLYQYNSNSVESCNAIISKFIGGKRINFAQKGSYQARCAGSVVQFNTQQALTSINIAMEKTPPLVAEMMEVRRKRTREKKNENLCAQKEKTKGHTAPSDEPKSKRFAPDKDYGPNAQRPDLDEEEFEMQKRLHFERLVLWQDERGEIELSTRQQSQSPRWLLLRKKLLTASHFARVCLRREVTSCQNLVKSILYPPTLRLPAMEYGLQCEKKARKQLEGTTGVQVQECGLFIDPELPFLGATPDGLVDEDGIVEIKCPYSARDLTPGDAISQRIGNTNTIFRKDDDTCMNEKHAYYYQVQGQLHVTRREYCIFVLWTQVGMKDIIVHRNDQFWQTKMEPFLTRFYEHCLVPEIIDSRFERNMPIREPQYIVDARRVKELKPK